MSIRLNKAIRELNIGFQTAVEFLAKKYNLGDGDLELTSKISDEQYESLIEAFKKDKETRNQVAQLFQKKPKEKKKVEVKDSRAETLLESSKQQKFNPLGKMDLEQLKKKPEEKNEAPTEKTVEPSVESVAPEKVKQEKVKVAAVTPEPKNEDQPKEKPQPAKVKEVGKKAEPNDKKPIPKHIEEAKVVVETPVAEPVVEEKVIPSEEKPQEKVVEKLSKEDKIVSQEKEKTIVKEEKVPVEDTDSYDEDDEIESSKPTLYQLNSEKKILENAPQLKIQGKLDLDSLNQSTRPKKKTKEEKRKEREEKNLLRGQQQEQRSEQRKKRDRINKVRVDINAASNQQPIPAESKKKDKKKKLRSRQKPLEVNEEDVARQVKETLARLTNKTTQNKKGAKYRKEKREAVQERLNEELSAERAESKT